MNNTTVPGYEFFFDGIDSLEMVFFVLQCSLLPLSMFGNVLILVSIYKYRWLQTPINYLIGNLSAIDLLVGVLCSPIGIVGNYLGLNKFRYMCLVDLTSFCIVLLLSATNMLAISIDRYVSVTLPFKHKARAMVHVKRFIPASWCAIVTYSLLPLIGWNHISDGFEKCRFQVVWPYLYQVLTWSYIVISVIFNIIFFSFVARVAVQKLPAGSVNQDKHLRRRIKKTYLMIVISALFIVCWAPYCIISLHRLFVPTQKLKEIQAWTFSLIIINSSINWMVYGLKTAKFRKAFRLLLCRTRSLDITRGDSNNSTSFT